MEKAILSAGIYLIPTIILIIGFKIKRRQVQWFPLLLSAIAFSIYLSLLRAGNIVPTPAFLGELTFNWVGKTLSIIGTLAMIYLLPNVGFRSVGLTWQQNKGSLKPVLFVGVIIIISMMITASFMGASSDMSAERLLFQATLPGLDEEIFLRGLLLLLLHQAFSKDLRIWGANTGWAFWLVVIFFCLLHGVTWQDSGISVNFFSFIVTGFIGIIVTWMRERTGSLVAPILFHNSINVALSFF